MDQGELFSQLNNNEWSEERMNRLKYLWSEGKTLEEIATSMQAPLDVIAGKVTKMIKES